MLLMFLGSRRAARIRLDLARRGTVPAAAYFCALVRYARAGLGEPRLRVKGFL